MNNEIIDNGEALLRCSGKAKLAQKICNILETIGQVEKAGENDFHKYKYFTEAQIMAELRTKLVQQKLIMITSTPKYTHDRQQGMDKHGNAKFENFATVQTQHTIIDAETGQEIAFFSCGQGVDSGDKAIYKAITGSVKYALMKTFFISDAQDPEGDAKVDEEAAPKKVKIEKEDPNRQLNELLQWAKDSSISEHFILSLMIEGKMVDANTKEIFDVSESILAKVNTKLGRDKILKRAQEILVIGNK